MYADGFNPRVMKFCSWCGVIFCLMWLGGAGPMTGWVYLPPPSAADAATQTVADYTHNVVLMRIGITLCNFASIFYLAWGMAVSFLVKKVERDYPILFYIQVLSLAVCVVVILYIAFFWAQAAWRPGETSAEITQAMNDLGWLGVLYTGAPFASYQIALGAVILLDRSEKPVYPRWSAYLNFFISIFMFEAAGILFFKTGPFSQNGLFVFYMPMIAFFVWIMLYSVLAMRAVKAEVAARGTVERRDSGVVGRSSMIVKGAAANP